MADLKTERGLNRASPDFDLDVRLEDAHFVDELGIREAIVAQSKSGLRSLDL